MNNHYLHINQLSIGYKTPLIENINFQLNTPQLIFIIGKNGSGKSTLLNTISGILPPLQGEVIIDNQSVHSLSIEKKSTLLSFVFSKNSLPFNLTVFELVALGRIPYLNAIGKLHKKDIEIIQHYIDLLGLTHFKNKNIQDLSDGEQQLAYIARALAQDTPFIILDEPTTFLDLYNAHKVLSYLQLLTKEYQKTILLSSHNLSLINDFADQLMVVYKEEKQVLLFDKNQIQSLDVNSFFGVQLS